MRFTTRMLLSTAVFLFFCWQVTLAEDACPHPRLISVTGTAETHVAPDEVVLTVGIQGRDRDLAVAKSQHDSLVKKVLAEARDASIEAKYVQTSSMQINAVYSVERVPRFLAYEITQTIQVTLKDLSRYESLVSRLIEGGVNRIDSVEFRVSESRKYKDETRLKAIRAAKEKATAMAAELGQTVGKPWEINEDPETNSYLYANTRMGAEAWDAKPNEPTVAPGQVTIRSSVRVSFMLD